MKGGDKLVAMINLGKQIMASTKDPYDADYWFEFLIWYIKGGKN